MTDYSEHLGRALKEFNDGFVGYVLASIRHVYPVNHSEKIIEFSGHRHKTESWDTPLVISLILSGWETVFSRLDGWTPFHKTLLHEVRHWRNQWAHHTHFDAQDAYRAVDCIYRLLKDVKLEKQEAQVFKIRNWLCLEAGKKIRDDYNKNKEITGISSVEKLDTMDLE